jgi:hypothetical protein
LSGDDWPEPLRADQAAPLKATMLALRMHQTRNLIFDLKLFALEFMHLPRIGRRTSLFVVQPGFNAGMALFEGIDALVNRHQIAPLQIHQADESQRRFWHFCGQFSISPGVTSNRIQSFPQTAALVTSLSCTHRGPHKM